MMHNLALVLIDLVKFLALLCMIVHKPLSAAGKPLMPKDLHSQSNQSDNFCAKLETLLNE